jgi:hypothetical protein
VTGLRNLIREIIVETEDDIQRHLQSRGVDFSQTKVIVDKKSGTATFLLYNLSGQLIGQQRYNPRGIRKSNDPVLARYYTQGKTFAVWGLETVYDYHSYIFIVEGIFDAIKLHNAGQPAIAVLTNDPQNLKSWFFVMDKRVISILDNDKASQKLKGVSDHFFVVPDPYSDLGDMPQNEVDVFVKDILRKVK